MPRFADDAFAGKTVVVTGGTTGIGQATAQYFAEHGARVYAVGLDRAKLYEGAPSQVDTFPEGLDVEVVELDVEGSVVVEVVLVGLSEVDVVGASVVVLEVGSCVVDSCVVVDSCPVPGSDWVKVGGALVSFTPARGGNCSIFSPLSAPIMKSVQMLVG